MNVLHYVGFFDQAMWHLVRALGYEPNGKWPEERVGPMFVMMRPSCGNSGRVTLSVSKAAL
jgi:hypothetical protein